MRIFLRKNNGREPGRLARGDRSRSGAKLITPACFLFAVLKRINFFQDIRAIYQRQPRFQANVPNKHTDCSTRPSTPSRSLATLASF